MIFTKVPRAITWFLIISSASLPMACSDQQTAANSDILVTKIDHTVAKRQSIGNCWLYAQATWLESLWLSSTGETIDISESYWTWWHWYTQIVDEKTKAVETGGEWQEGLKIIAKYGWVLEGEFIKDEAGKEMSKRQEEALNYINKQLKSGGHLSSASLRTPENVRLELDKAFGTNMVNALALRRDASTAMIKTGKDRAEMSVMEAMLGSEQQRWNIVTFPEIYGKGTHVPSSVKDLRDVVLRRVKLALNDQHPVVMSMKVDFNALDHNDTTFKASLLKKAGRGEQGGHMVVLSDYTAINVPQVGYIGEGDVSPELKAAALAGDVGLFKAKNSWGVVRPDRGLTDGYTRFDYDYLAGQFNWQSIYKTKKPVYITTLDYFVLPPGY